MKPRITKPKLRVKTTDENVSKSAGKDFNTAFAMLLNPRPYFARVRLWLSGPPVPQAAEPTPTSENDSPVTPSFQSSSSDEEINRASAQAFTAYELAMRCGHHLKLWNAVKGSPFQSLYERNLRVRSDAFALDSNSP